MRARAPRRRAKAEQTVVRLPSFEQVSEDPVMYAHASRVLHLEANPGNARAAGAAHGDRDVWLNPPPIPLTTDEMDGVYDLPVRARAAPVATARRKIPAWDMIRFSVNIMRGCFGGCTFCSITEHEGRIIQSRSERVDPARDRADPRHDQGLHRHHLRPRRPDRQHVPPGLQGQADRDGVPPPVLRVPDICRT